MTDTGTIRWVLVFSEIWRSAGWDSLLYLAAIIAIDPALYDSAEMDGANRWQKIRDITLPGIAPTIATLFILNAGLFLSADLNQVINLQNDVNLRTIDIIDTYVYRIGLQTGEYSLATAAGLFKAVFGMILIVAAHFISQAPHRQGSVVMADVAVAAARPDPPRDPRAKDADRAHRVRHHRLDAAAARRDHRAADPQPDRGVVLRPEPGRRDERPRRSSRTGFSLEVWSLLLQHPNVQRGILNSILITGTSTVHRRPRHRADGLGPVAPGPARPAPDLRLRPRHHRLRAGHHPRLLPDEADGPARHATGR